MIYKDFQQEKLSMLGLGCMRFPLIEGTEDVDLAATGEMVDYAIANGVNYFDTAWFYHNGKSESIMGQLLSKYPRESYYLATKFPGYSEKNLARKEEIFEEQLRRCQTDYFDFYLCHSVTDTSVELYLDPQYGLIPFLMEQKRLGRIRHIGFSNHGSLETVKRMFAAYGDVLEFCQVQLNWLDWDFQKANALVEYLNEIQVPIWVMEPLRGGSLCTLAPKYTNILQSLAPKRSLPEWGFRYLQSIPGVTVVLSGMSNMAQLKENVQIFGENAPLSTAAVDTLLKIGADITASNKIPCTKCNYCTAYCPQKLDIPGLIAIYNEYEYTPGGFIAPEQMKDLSEEQKPSACIGCGACEQVCPQKIEIRKMMDDFTARICHK